MDRIVSLVRICRYCVPLSLANLSLHAVSAEVNLVRTNITDRWITNIIEVRMPVNRFVNEYHTNWVEQLRTKVVKVYSTNWVTRTVTNQVAINAVRANTVTEYKTNWQTIRVTKVVPVELSRTNVAEVKRTNWATLNLTNWQTVVIMRTNWIAQPVTNVVQIDMIASRVPAAPSETPLSKEVKAEPPAILTDAVLIEAAKTVRPAANGQVEVRLTVKWASGVPAPFQVQQWRVERQDGAILCFGQDQEFSRELPAGEYKVEVRGQQDQGSPLLAARGTLTLTRDGAVVKQKLLVKK